MSTPRLSSVEELIPHVTVVGKLLPETPEDHMKLARLAWSFRRTTELMVREVANGTPMKKSHEEAL